MENVTHIRVTNKNDFPITDYFDGIARTFETGKALTIPLDAATLFFGFPVVMDEGGNASIQIAVNHDHIKRRYGWSNVEKLKDENMVDAVMRVNTAAQKYCDNIALEPVSMIMQEVVHARAEELPPPRAEERSTLKLSVPK